MQEIFEDAASETASNDGPVLGDQMATPGRSECRDRQVQIMSQGGIRHHLRRWKQKSYVELLMSRHETIGEITTHGGVVDGQGRMWLLPRRPPSFVPLVLKTLIGTGGIWTQPFTVCGFFAKAPTISERELTVGCIAVKVRGWASKRAGPRGNWDCDSIV